jgi:hypothetical protein
VTHFYDGSPGLGRPGRDRFVIFIEAGVHMHERLPGLQLFGRTADACRIWVPMTPEAPSIAPIGPTLSWPYVDTMNTSRPACLCDSTSLRASA